MMNSTSFTRRLLVLNGLAILGVVIYHASMWGFTSVQRVGDLKDLMGTFSYYGLRAGEQFIMYGVASFLFISGYFVSFSIGRIEAKKQWVVIFARIKNLIIPFLIWSILILILDTILGNRYSINDALFTIIAGKARIPFYYVPLLVQFLILSPILVYLAKKRCKLLLISTAIIQLVIVGLRYDTLFGIRTPAIQSIIAIASQSYFPSRIFFFTFGIVVGLNFSEFKQFKQKLVHYRYGLLISLVVLFIIGIIEWEFRQKATGEITIGQIETVLDNFYSFIFILCFFAFEDAFPPFPKQLEVLGAMSYGIYLIHWSVEEYLSKIFVHVFPSLVKFQIVIQPIFVVFGLGLPVLLMIFIKRSPGRKYYRYLFG